MPERECSGTLDPRLHIRQRSAGDSLSWEVRVDGRNQRGLDAGFRGDGRALCKRLERWSGEKEDLGARESGGGVDRLRSGRRGVSKVVLNVLVHKLPR